MLVTLIGGVVLGGIVSGCAQKKKAQKEREALELELKNQREKDRKLKLQTDFFDAYRALDNKLARMVRKGYKGVAYLEKGLKIVHGSMRDINACKEIRQIC